MLLEHGLIPGRPEPQSFARAATIVHVDIDNRELNNKISVPYPIHANVKDFLIRMCTHCNSDTPKNYDPWIAKNNQFKKRYPSFSHPTKSEIDPNYFLHILSQNLPDDAILCVDVGQIQMWAAQNLEIKKSQRFLTEGGMASIGSAVPLAIGASFAKPGTQIIAITGDGGFQLNIQELQTIYHHQLPVKTILLNNDGYGMIKQFQEQYLDSKFQSSGIGYSVPDFQDVVSAYKIPSTKIFANDEIVSAVKHLVSDLGSGFLEVIIDEQSRATPKLAVNRPVEDQEPLLPREELKSNMIIEMVPEPKQL